jgi:hypothetical protein
MDSDHAPSPTYFKVLAQGLISLNNFEINGVPGILVRLFRGKLKL